MKNILCIVNPVSGLKKSLKVYYELENIIKDHGFIPELLITKYAGHARKVVSECSVGISQALKTYPSPSFGFSLVYKSFGFFIS